MRVLPADPLRQTLQEHEWNIHPVPLSVLVQENDDQLGEHLVALLAEGQVPAFERHIHEVPEDESFHTSQSLTVHRGEFLKYSPHK